MLRGPRKAEESVFRNLRAYRLQSEWPTSEMALAEQLETKAFKPCAATTSRASGWESPVPVEPDAASGPLVLRGMGAELMQLRIQSRLLPPAAIKEALEERLLDFARRTQRAPSRTERRELKESVTDQLLPRALLKSERVRVLCLPKDQLLLVDTATEAVAELVTERLRDALGSLLIVPLEYRQPVGAWLEQLFLGQGPTTFTVSRECRMQEPGNAAANVAFSDIDLGDTAVQRHVKQGLVLDRLGLVFDGVLGFTMDRDGVLRKLRLLDQAAADGDEQADPSAVARLDADLVLWSGLLMRLFRGLKKQLGGHARAR